MSKPAIEITLRDKKWCGPGGHWLRYRAVYSDDPNGLAGYGDTLREARLDLQKQSRSGTRAGDTQEMLHEPPPITTP
jgi:hypothetical protein